MDVFRADTDTIFFFSSALADEYTDTNFLDPLFRVDTAFAPSVYIIKMTQ